MINSPLSRNPICASYVILGVHEPPHIVEPLSRLLLVPVVLSRLRASTRQIVGNFLPTVRNVWFLAEKTRCKIGTWLIRAEARAREERTCCILRPIPTNRPPSPIRACRRRAVLWPTPLLPCCPYTIITRWLHDRFKGRRAIAGGVPLAERDAMREAGEGQGSGRAP